jgi:hypothetical protein
MTDRSPAAFSEEAFADLSRRMAILEDIEAI